MFQAARSATRAMRLASCLLLIAVLALSFHYQFDVVSGSGIASFLKMKAKAIKAHFGDTPDQALTKSWKDQALSLGSYFLRVDYKQNLLVWPVVATNISRSPPSIAS